MKLPNIFYFILGLPYILEGLYWHYCIPCASCGKYRQNTTIIKNKHYCGNCDMAALKKSLKKEAKKDG